MSDLSFNLSGKIIDELISIVGIGVWDWNLQTNKVVYSQAWAEILGYNAVELPQIVDTWECMVLPEDLPSANQQIELHLRGKKPIYEAEFRMMCKDGSIVWAQDKGRVIEYDSEGNPVRFVGVLQSVTRLKQTELELRKNQASLDLAVSVAGLGTWDWDIEENLISYNNEYLRMMGYSQSDMNGSMEEWEGLNHPEDLPRATKLLGDYLAGKIPFYECEIRMKRRDGTYIWTRDVGRIVSWDSDNKPTRIIGGHLNIDALKRSEERLKQALNTLEHGKQDLENKIESRTRELYEHDQMLWSVNQISRRLLSFQPDQNFEQVVQDCLSLLGENVKKNRVYIWKDRTNEKGETFCTQIYEWVRDVAPIQGLSEYEEISYANLPNFRNATESGVCLNSRVADLAPTEQELLLPQGIRSILIAPVSVNGRRWGFVGVDNCDDESGFTEVEENLLFMSGSMIANAIEKMDHEEQMREMDERSQIMLNAMPLCCNLWSPELVNMRCNDEAVRLFEMSSQDEYLKRFHELSPRYQPSGRLSSELAAEYVMRTFDEGYCCFEWLHQKLDGTPVPAEITLVRIKHKDGFIVAGYTRDLREQKAMLTEIQAKEDDLRNARDEALLSSQAKSNFLANMSHEIRTPMNAISGLAEIILRESPHGKAAEYALSIRNACNNLLNIINDILDISKIESGKLEVIPDEYDLASLLNDVITISKMRIGSKQLVFLTNIDSHLPARLVGDEIRIKQVLINLLSNAIKFTQTGYISLKVTGVVMGDHARLKFTVTDTGSGIQKKDLDRLFAEFERVNTKKNRNIEGTGLGLAISKQLCEMMGGKISVESVYGQGSAFTAIIPQTAVGKECISVVDEKKSVLLYEPRELYRQSISESIENLGCTCVQCKNQSDLYDNIHKMPYDYIVTAFLHLEKVQYLVQRNRLNAKVAVVADYAQVVDDDSAYTIVFPVNCLQLSDMLNGHCSTYSAKYEIGGSFTAPDARVLIVDDNPVNLSVASGLMAPYKFAIDTAVNGIEAVYMVKHNRYDLVFMDHMMPEMDGIDATNAIRKLDGDYCKNLPIIALTANALMGTREMFLKEGMNDFLAKPIEVNKLGNTILKWLPESKVLKQEAGTSSVGAYGVSAPLNISGVDTARGLASIGGSLERYMHILSVYYEDGVKKIPLFKVPVNSKNISAFRTEIHAIKSASASIGALSLSSLAASLEAAAKDEDTRFIDENIGAFLTEFNRILEELRHTVKPTEVKETGESRAKGSSEYLEIKLKALEEAAEFANIRDIEEILADVSRFEWQREVTEEIAAVKEFSAIFDYDGVIESVNKLRGIINFMQT